MCDCLLTNARLRADKIDPMNGTVYSYKGASHEESGWSTDKTYSVLAQEGQDEKFAAKTAKQYYAKFLSDKSISFKKLALVTDGEEVVTDVTTFNPENGSLLTPAREFNLMFKTQMGASADESDSKATAYLRPETAQSIFTQYKNISDTSRLKLPFGIAQIGKAFRNEINPRNYTFRSREFEQMEIEYFCRPEDGLRLTDEWLEARLAFYEAIGIPREKIHVVDVPDGERAHYSSKTYDLEYEFPFGIDELEGVAYRGNYDLSKHREHSGKPIEYFDDQTKEKFLPHVVEPSAGCDRAVLALLCEAYDEEELVDSKGKTDVRIVLRLDPKVAPIKVAILPLLKKSEEQVEIAKQLQAKLQKHMNVFYDETGAVGRRYRRMDEVGTPYCITIDFETLGQEAPELKDTVTIRHRDSMEQERIPLDDVLGFLLDKIV